MAKQRGHGEGTITQRKDGRWEARISLEGGKRKVLYGKTRREVADKLKVALHDQQQGLPVATDRQTVGQFLNHWLEQTAKPTVRPSTYTRYEKAVRCHLLPDLGKLPLSKLAPQHVQKLLNDKMASGQSPRSVLHIRAILRTALNQALKWGLVARNAAALVDPPRAIRHEFRALGPDEAVSFLEAIHGDRMEVLYHVTLSLGLRQGEVLGLRWQDVDLEARTLRVQVALQRVDGKPQLVEPKSATSRRTLALSDTIIAALRAHRVKQLQDRLLAGDRWQEQGLIFASTIGTPLDGTNVTHRLQAILERASLPRIRFHDLRHSCASLLVAQGLHARIIMETLGHSQISLTMNTYAHVAPMVQREAADMMERILQGKR